MDTPLAEYLDKQLGRPVRNLVRFHEVRRAVDHDIELHDSSNTAKITYSGFQHSQQFDCHMARRELCLIQTDLISHFPAEEIAAFLAKAAGKMNLVSCTYKRRERRGVSGYHWRYGIG